MKKKYRIKRNEEFGRIISTGKHTANKKFVMYYTPASFEYDRIGISVGKKIGNAVERNKVKRQLRMMIHETFDFNSGYDYIIIVRTTYNDSNYEQNKNYLSEIYSSVYNK